MEQVKKTSFPIHPWLLELCVFSKVPGVNLCMFLDHLCNQTSKIINLITQNQCNLYRSFPQRSYVYLHIKSGKCFWKGFSLESICCNNVIIAHVKVIVNTERHKKWSKTLFFEDIPLFCDVFCTYVLVKKKQQKKQNRDLCVLYWMVQPSLFYF